MILYLLAKVAVDHVYDANVLKSGVVLMFLYGMPFILTGAIVAHFVVKRAGKHGLLINTALGALFSIVVVLAFHLYEKRGLSYFFIITCIIGAASNYWGWKVKNERVAYALAAVFPIVILLIFA